MPIEDTDLLLVNRNGASHYLAAGDFNDKIQDDDLLLVNRNGQSFRVTGADLADKLADDDLMLVNRNGQSYKATGADIQGILEPEFVETNRPGIVYSMDPGQKLVKKIVNQPVLVTNAFGNNPSYTGARHYFVGVDGKIYYVDVQALNTMSLDPNFSSVTNAKKIFANGTSSDKTSIVYKSDGTVYLGQGLSGDSGFPTSEQGNFIDIVGNGLVPIFGVYTENQCWVNCKWNPAAAPSFGSYDFSARDVWVDSGIVMPAGEKIKKICGFPTPGAPQFGIFGLAILAQSGNLYTAFNSLKPSADFTGAPSGNGRNGSPELWLTDVKDVNWLLTPSFKGGLSVLKKNGTLWYGTNSDHINLYLPQARDWGETTAGGNDYRSTIYYGSEASATWGIVKSDGKIYRPADGTGVSASDNYVQLDYQGFPDGALTSFGAMPQTMGQTSPQFYIIPPT